MATVSERKRAFLSNGITAALELGGSIDWFPCPKFDSDPIFSAILDEKKGGAFSILPEEKNYKLESGYIPCSLAFKNVFTTDSGKLEVTDFLPLGIPGIIRIYSSSIPFIARISPSFEFGLVNPWLEETDMGIVFKNGKAKDGLEVSIKGSYSLLPDGAIRIDKGKGYIFALYSKDLKYGLFGKHGSVYADPEDAYDAQIRYWEDQISQAKRVRRFREAYEISLMVIMGLLYGPSGGIIAAPTTSLPEIIGKGRNWDYRYVWIRDAAYACEALTNSGILSKSRRILSFMASVIDPSSKPFNHPLYSIDGTAPRPEEILYWMEGHMKSKPVRVGNEAYMQMQTDVEGAFMEAMYVYTFKSGDKEYLNECWWAIEAIVRWVKGSWADESVGIWEDRGKMQHFVHSKVMDWVAVDRAASLANMIGLNGKVEEWKALAAEIRSDIMEKGFLKEANSFTVYYGSNDVDASLLTLPLYGFIDARDPRFVSTLKRIESELSLGSEMLMRYTTDSMGKVENPFTLLSTWLARVYVRLGEKEKAVHIIQELINSSNDYMLIGEHADLVQKVPRGNFPQLFPHAGLVQAINVLEESKS